jgi:hypothetical protein
MKKLLITLVLLLILITGCRKESGCGVVRGGDYDNFNNTHSYYLWIQFDGSSRSRQVYVDYKTFIDYRIGDKICFN